MITEIRRVQEDGHYDFTFEVHSAHSRDYAHLVRACQEHHSTTSEYPSLIAPIPEDSESRAISELKILMDLNLESGSRIQIRVKKEGLEAFTEALEQPHPEQARHQV